MRKAMMLFLANVASVTGCGEERIFVVPGNHDVSQAVVDKTRETHMSWRKSAEDVSYLNQLYQDSGFCDVASEKFSDYLWLQRYLDAGHIVNQDDFSILYHVDAINVDILVFNTAMLSTGGHQSLGSDQRVLAIPEHAILGPTKHFRKDAYKIIATHHPLGMMSESTERILRDTLYRCANLHVFGHMHDPQSVQAFSFKGQLFSDQAGAVYTDRKTAYIGYSLIGVDRDKHHYEVLLRTYFDDRKEFDEARDVVESGRFYSSQEARSIGEGSPLQSK